MRAMVFDHYGDPDVMSLRGVPVPEPQNDEILIRVAYAGVNPSDSKARSGQSARGGYRYRDVNFPFVTGMDAAGVVERTGPNVTDFRQGDRVITWSEADGKTWGSYADFMRVSARHVSPMPKSLNFAQAAAVPVASLTAFQALFHAEKGGMIPGQKCSFTGRLVASAASPYNLRKAEGCWSPPLAALPMWHMSELSVQMALLNGAFEHRREAVLQGRG